MRRRNHPQQQQQDGRVVKSVFSDADHAELQRHYQFVPDNTTNHELNDDTAAATGSAPSTWQQRMVQHYHQHLYKEYVLADMTRAISHRQLGLRWRTRTEVESGKGSTSCGNKHCPSLSYYTSAEDSKAKASRSTQEDSCRYQQQQQQEYRRLYLDTDSHPTTNQHPDGSNNSSHHGDRDDEQEEMDRLCEILPHGALQHDFEVPFSYVEQNEPKMELVKLRLCLRCVPLLLASQGETTPALATKRMLLHLQQQQQQQQQQPDKDISNEQGTNEGRSMETLLRQDDDDGNQRRYAKRKGKSEENLREWKKRRETDDSA